MDDWASYERMVLIRCFEEAVERLFSEGRIMGTAHVCIGQEAVAVGVAAALRPGDALTSTHRGHGHFIAVGGDPGRMMAEMFGKATGYSRGRGGSQMMADTALGFYGSNGITAGSMAFACGLALEAQHRRTGRAVVCIIGDGAANEGLFHESLNLAALWRLPLVVICENNRYAMSTPVAAGLANTRLAERGAAYGIPGCAVDGNVVADVRAAVETALARARAGSGPSLVECETYRLSGHSKGDPRAYRSPAEEADAWQREPIRHLEAHLRAAGNTDPARFAACRTRAEQAIAVAIRFAEASPAPDPATVTEGVFASD
ncbi:MAG: thiamine pyrophosphate-dependent dehydrogenase E1 component subunit alpha [Lentisphaerae bacterium]|nr:thiamine pyrophosphate-dependent dehydrogenase E1 component subunit alpha [Lentisphaerota bacterium]